jgi:hypothetical protein
MKLGGKNLRGIIEMIIARGGKSFLDSLVANRILHDKKDIHLCPVCHETAGTQDVAYRITNRDAVRMFDDLFNWGQCARHMIAWLHHVHDGFLDYLNYNQSRVRTIEEFPEAFVKMCIRQFPFQNYVHIQRLNEFIPKVDPEVERFKNYPPLNNVHKE